MSKIKNQTHRYNLHIIPIFILLIIGTLIIISGFRKDTRKPFKNYVVLVSFDAFRWDYD